MAMSEKIKIVLLKRKMTVTSLAEMIGTTRSNLSNKLSRDNFSEKELKEIAEALNCDLDMNFTLRDTGEQVYSSEERTYPGKPYSCKIVGSFLCRRWVI